MNILIGKVLGKETFKTTAGRYMTYIHIKALKSTDKKVFGFSQIECDFTLTKKICRLKISDLMYVEFSHIREDIHNGRIRKTIECEKFSKGKGFHFKKIDKILMDRRD
jgi:hypothetical protein